MGLRTMLGLKRPKEQKASKTEKVLADISLQQAGRYTGTYLPLQRELEAEADRDYSSTLRGRAMADTMRMASNVAPHAANLRYLGTQDTIGAALGNSLTSASRAATNSSVAQRTAAMKAGLGNLDSPIGGLSTAAQLTSQKTQSDLALAQAKADARASIFGSALGGITAAKLYARPDTLIDTTQSIPATDMAVVTSPRGNVLGGGLQPGQMYG